MENLIQKSIVSLIVFFAILVVLGTYTQAHLVLIQANPFFLAIACIFFLASIFFWIISWAYLIKKHSKIPYSKLFIVGWSSHYGSLTPIQLGTEALRSMKLKQFFRVPYSSSISSSMIVKGTKFVILAALFIIILWAFMVDARLDPLMFLSLFGGFFVIVLAAVLFLLPLNRKIGFFISKFFSLLAKNIPFFSYLSDFFYNYSNYLKTISFNSIFLVILLSIFSWGFEFLALQFSFFSFGINLPLTSIIVLFVLIAILEHTPLLPRGIGLVEFLGFVFLSIPHFAQTTLTVAQIGAVLIAFDVVRLIVPTIVSVIIGAVFKLEVQPEKRF